MCKQWVKTKNQDHERPKDLNQIVKIRNQDHETLLSQGLTKYSSIMFPL
jgi:hypothetical protein